MSRKVIAVMYHYVRDLKNSRYPDLKGLDIELFKEQILYLKKHYNFITIEELIDAIDNGSSLPEHAVLLTFDDAFMDHYTNVFPVLVENEVQGSFYIPVKVVEQNSVLDVHKIHFILASGTSPKKLLKEIFGLLDKYRSEFSLHSNDFYYSKFAVANRFDSLDVIFIKRLLQVVLKEELRGIITRELFNEFVGISESAFSKELYMSIDQIKTMMRFGMHIGSHGYDHYWFNSLRREKQETEIIKSINFLEKIGLNKNAWTMCYPYGAFNNDTSELLNLHNCKLAFTTNFNVADLDKENKFILSRLDTNDLPMYRLAKPDKWLIQF